MPSELLSISEDRVMVLTISSADGRNLLTPAVCSAATEALNTAADSAETDAVVIIGAGSHFSWGEDLASLEAAVRGRSSQDSSEAVGVVGTEWTSWLEAMATFPKPVVAAVDGAAAGAGLALALACDLIVATVDAAFSMPHGASGLMPAPGAVWHAMRCLPPHLANELLMDASPLTAARLQAAGSVGRIVARGALHAEAVAWASRLGRIPGRVMGDIKESLGAARRMPLDACLVREQARYLHHLHRNTARDALQDATTASISISHLPKPWTPHS